jgi:hypothetical protein
MGAAFAPAPAHAALGANKSISIENVAYTCKADNGIINTSIGGPQTFFINARSTVPSAIGSGDTIPSTKATLDLVMPDNPLMDRVRGLGVQKIAGSATSDVEFDAVATSGPVGSISVAVNNLAATAQSVPTDGSMTIANVQGTVPSFNAPTLPGDALIYVELPLYFQLHAVLAPPVLGSIDKTDLNCYRQKDTADQRVIGTIAVGAGTPSSAYALPSVDRSCVPNWADSSQSGSGCKIEPDVVGDAAPPPDPSDPADPGNGTSSGGSGSIGDNAGGSNATNQNNSTGGNDADGKGSHHNSDDSGSDGKSDGTTEVAATTALPDTGSPVKPWLFGVLALAVAARAALFARRRVARAGDSRRAR